MPHELPNRDELQVRHSTHAKENDWRYLLAGFLATFGAGIVKVMLMNHFDKGNNPEDDLE